MSSARGNVKKRGPPKHQNKSAFKNDLHDKSKKMQFLNAMKVTGCCARCKDIIDWKIKYKKYKPLTVPKKCTKCQQKTVKRAYYMICEPCAVREKVCSKCGEHRDFVIQPEVSDAEEASQHAQYMQEFKGLSERQKRTVTRLQASGKLVKELQNSSDKCEDETSDLSSEDEDDFNPEGATGTSDMGFHQENAGCIVAASETVEHAEEQRGETFDNKNPGGVREDTIESDNADHVTTGISHVKISSKEHKDGSSNDILIEKPDLEDKSS